ncbi:MAG: hypothetical protein A2Y34_14540 [Spirochaetes bacterium GWC1_27_15]|nr:MAG: hypothetical protein A2Z98_11995 [Spirochaetes bacterium GWB1_27_13]OHD26255.1 MAG: hypothetical protein A2Y34_14540 [Spirochaetes bacterium GWC1_27_15]
METLEIIKKQVKDILILDTTLTGLESVITHIERAESYLKNGNNDGHLFNDVIYRTNHAFEGILKEAYKVFTKKKCYKKTPSEIEKFLLRNNILNSKVIESLKNYREEWRNPSTHDYNLFFSYNDAYFALISISAFVHILLNQIAEKIYCDRQLLKNDVFFTKQNFSNDFEKLPLLDKIFSITAGFIKKDYKYIDRLKKIKVSKLKNEVIRNLISYIISVDKTIKIDRESLMNVNKRRLFSEIILKDKEELVLIQIKINKTDAQFTIESIIDDKLLSYLLYSKISNDTLFILPDKTVKELKFNRKKENLLIGNQLFKIVNIEPSFS